MPLAGAELTGTRSPDRGVAPARRRSTIWNALSSEFLRSERANNIDPAAWRLANDQTDGPGRYSIACLLAAAAGRYRPKPMPLLHTPKSNLANPSGETIVQVMSLPLLSRASIPRTKRVCGNPAKCRGPVDLARPAHDTDFVRIFRAPKRCRHHPGPCCVAVRRKAWRRKETGNSRKPATIAPECRACKSDFMQ